MSLSTEEREIGEVVNRMLDSLALTIESQVGREGIAFRSKVGDIRARYMDYLKAGTFPTQLLTAFNIAYKANPRLGNFRNMHTQLFAENPIGEISIAIVQVSIGFCLSIESKLVTALEFTSRDDVDAMIKIMKEAFDVARELAADAADSSAYQALTALAGSVTAHLADEARPLPRMVTFKSAATEPALVLSNRFYYAPGRWEELVNENKIVHPAFCPRELRGLAS